MEVRRIFVEVTEQGNGFGNRFLWVCVRRSKALPEGGAPWPSELDRLLPRLLQAREFAKSVQRFERTPEARELWADMYRQLSEGAPGLLGAMTARAEAQVMRLACLYALFDLVPEVRPVHLRSAHALWRYCEDSARFIFGESTGDPDADRILVELRKRGQLDATQIRDLLGHHGSEERRLRIAERFVREGLARIDSVPTGGRDREVWTAVQPAAAQSATPVSQPPGAAQRDQRDERVPPARATDGDNRTGAAERAQRAESPPEGDRTP